MTFGSYDSIFSRSRQSSGEFGAYPLTHVIKKRDVLRGSGSVPSPYAKSSNRANRNFEKFLYTNGFSCAILYRVNVSAAHLEPPERFRRAVFPALMMVFFQDGTRFPAGQINKCPRSNPEHGPKRLSYSVATGRCQTSAGVTGPGGQRASLLCYAQIPGTRPPIHLFILVRSSMIYGRKTENHPSGRP